MSCVNPLTILVVDDSRTIRRTMRSILEKEGHRVVEAADGFAALRIVVDKAPAMIFVDIMMPRLDGYQTCLALRGSTLAGQIPIVLLSSKEGLFDKAQAMRAGASRYMTKPFSREELLACIAEMDTGAVALDQIPTSGWASLSGQDQDSPPALPT